MGAQEASELRVCGEGWSSRVPTSELQTRLVEFACSESASRYAILHLRPLGHHLRPTMHTRNKNLPLQQGCPLYSNCHRGEARSQGRSTMKRSAGRAMAVLATIPSARAQAPGAASAQTTRSPVKPAARTAGGRVARVSDMTCEQSRSASRTSDRIAIWEKGTRSAAHTKSHQPVAQPNTFGSRRVWFRCVRGAPHCTSVCGCTAYPRDVQRTIQPADAANRSIEVLLVLSGRERSSAPRGQPP